jgi:hypothetical protein
MSCNDKVFPYNLNFDCPSSETFLRFVFDNYKIGKVTDGVKDFVKVDLSKFFKSLKSFKYVNYNIKPGEEIFINVNDISTFGERHHVCEIDISTFSSFSSISSIVLIFSGTLFTAPYVKTINITTTLNTFSDLVNLLKNEIANDNNINDKLYITSYDLINQKIKFKGLEIGKTLNISFDFKNSSNNVIFSASTTDILHAIRYPNKNVLSFIFLVADYCNDCSENYKKILWCLFSEYPNGWKKMGKMLVLSSSEDVLETDENLFETIYLKNTSNCDVNVYGVVAV